MLQLIAHTLTQQGIKKGAIQPEEESLYQYGYEISLSTLGGILAVLLLSAFTTSVFYGILFLIIFTPIRFFAGGYHANSYLKCFLTMIVLYSLVLFIFLSTPSAWYVWLVPGIATLSGIMIFGMAPIVSKSNPLSSKKIIRNKRISRLMIFFEWAIVAAVYFIRSETREFAYFASLALLSVAALMILAKVMENAKDNSRPIKADSRSEK